MTECRSAGVVGKAPRATSGSIAASTQYARPRTGRAPGSSSSSYVARCVRPNYADVRGDADVGGGGAQLPVREITSARSATTSSHVCVNSSAHDAYPNTVPRGTNKGACPTFTSATRGCSARHMVHTATRLANPVKFVLPVKLPCPPPCSAPTEVGREGGGGSGTRRGSSLVLLAAPKCSTCGRSPGSSRSPGEAAITGGAPTHNDTHARGATKW